jgi:hypothetical protein
MLTQIPEQLPPTPEGFAVCTPMGDNTPPLLINNLPSLKLFGRLESLGGYLVLSLVQVDCTH